MNISDGPLYCCKHCKGLFNRQDEGVKHQQTCLGNPFKSTCLFFACERKIFLQLFQSEDFQSDNGYFSTQNMSKDDSFLNHIVKVRLPQDIIDPSIFLRTPVNTSSAQMAEDTGFLLDSALTDRGDSNFLLDRNLPDQGSEMTRDSTACTSFLLGSDVNPVNRQLQSRDGFLLTSNIDQLENNGKKSAESTFRESVEEERIRKIINKNIDYLKSSEITNLAPSMSKSGTFPTSHSESRLLSPIDKHFLPYGSKSRMQSPFEKAMNFLDSSVSLNPNQCMYASNSSLPFSCNLSTDLLSSLASTQDDNQPSLLNNIEESPTLQYLDLAKKDPFFGQNLGLAQVNMKDPFLINAGDKPDKAPPQPIKEPAIQLTKTSDDFQSSPSFPLNDTNYFNFPSILDEPTQLDYLDLATLDFLTNPNFTDGLGDDSLSNADACDNLTESVEDNECTSGTSAKRGKNSKMKSLALKKVKSQIEKKKKTQAQREKETFSALSQGLNLEVKVMPKTSKIKVNPSSRKRKITPTQDSLDNSECSEEKVKSKFDRKFNEKQRICQTGQILNIKDQLTGFTDEEKDSMKAVFGQNGCIIVKKQKLASHRSSCFENVGVAFVNERPVLRRANSLDERSDRPKEVPDQEQLSTFRYLEGDAPGPFGISVGQRRNQGNFTSVLKLKCQECDFKCSTVSELKEHYDQHESDKKELDAECESVLGHCEAVCGPVDDGCVFSLDLNGESSQTNHLQADVISSVPQMVTSSESEMKVIGKFENSVHQSHRSESDKVAGDFNFDDLVGSLSQSFTNTTYPLDSSQTVVSISTACGSVAIDTSTDPNDAAVSSLASDINSLPDLLDSSLGAENRGAASYSASNNLSAYKPTGNTRMGNETLNISRNRSCTWNGKSENLDDAFNNLIQENPDVVDSCSNHLARSVSGCIEKQVHSKPLPAVRSKSESAFVKYTKVSTESVSFSDNSSLQSLESVQVLQPEPFIVVEKDLCHSKSLATKEEAKGEVKMHEKASVKSQGTNTVPEKEYKKSKRQGSPGSRSSDKKSTSSKLNIHEKCKESLKSFLNRKSKDTGTEKSVSASKVTKATKRTQTPADSFDEDLDDDGEETDDEQTVGDSGAAKHRSPSRQNGSASQKTKSKKSQDKNTGKSEDSSKAKKAQPKPVEFLTCDMCNYRTKCQNYMKEHMRKHDGNYLYCSVPDCEFKTVYLRNLNMHLRKHGTVRSLLCDQCACIFNDLNSLRRHIQHHHLQERRFKCPECEFVTLFRGDVLKHYRNMHRQQKLYACNQCEYRTGYTHLLKFHLMAHAGIRPYKCSACDYQVNNYNKVTRHIRTRHAGEEGIRCEKLDLTFEVDAKQFQCEDKMSDKDVHVIELTDEQIKEYAIKKREEKKANEDLKDQEKSKRGNKSQNYISSEGPRMVSLLGDLTKIAQNLKETPSERQTKSRRVRMRESKTLMENYLNNNTECSVLVDHSVGIVHPLDNMRPDVIELVKIPVQSDDVESYDTAYQCVLCAYMSSSYGEVTEHLTHCCQQKIS